MKPNRHLQWLFYLGLLLLATGCVNFVNPQPIGQPDEAVFPEELRGAYIKVKDGDTLVIGADRYYTTSEVWFEESVHNLDAVRIKGDRVYYFDSKQEHNAVGYATITKMWQDTIQGVYSDVSYHYLGNDILLRKVDRGFLINHKTRSKWWDIGLLFLRDDTLVVQELNRDTLLARIDAGNIVFQFDDKGQLTGDLDAVIRKDSIRNMLSNEVYLDLDWTRKQWDEQIANGIFSDKPHSTFVRIKQH